jgi:hypothetical protein
LGEFGEWHLQTEVAMSDRRRYPRFLLRIPVEGTLRFAREVIFERYDADEVRVLSPVPAGPNEVFRIRDVALRPPLALDASVQESTPTMVDGTVHHRLRLRLSLPRDVAHRADIMGTLGRDVSVQMREVNRAGCLLESQACVEVGAVAEIVLMVAGRVSSGVVRIARAQLLPGHTNAFRIGAEFVSRGASGTLRPAAVDRLATDEEWTNY